MMTMPSCAGSAVHSAVRIKRRGARQRVLPGEPGAERALIHVEIRSSGFLPNSATKMPNSTSDASKRERGDDDVFRRAAESCGRNGGRRRNSPTPDLQRTGRADIGFHEVAPITPSTR